MAQDSSNSGFWDTRYRHGVTPWDAGGVPPRLAVWLSAKTPGLKVLIPGCGTGYEVRVFAQHGDDVLAIDFSDSAVEAARRELGPLAHRVRQADFFKSDLARHDIVYERALLCALPRSIWPLWAARMAQLVRPGGELAGFFYFNDNDRGPPFGAAPDQIAILLHEAFDLAEDIAIAPEQSIPVFKGKERWQVWTRRL
jgi:SAM-dependent methyltransferase